MSLSIFKWGAALLLFIGSASAASAQTHPELSEIWRLSEGLAGPESVVVDPKSGALFISSMKGKGDALDGNGYVSRISSQGEMLDQNWLTGLDAPKGLAISGGVLFGTDIQKMFGAKVSGGKMLFRRTVEQANYLNDTAKGEGGSVWVTDARGNSIWQVTNRGERKVHAPPSLVRPNGLTAVGRTIFALVGSPGEGDPGDRRSIYRIDQDGSIAILPTTPVHFGTADGLESDGRGGWFLTTNAAQEVIHVSKTGASKVLVKLESNTTDLHFDRKTNRLYVPLGRANALVAFDVKW